MSKSKKGGLRHNSGKPRVHLVPEEAIIAMALGFMAGEKKYPKFNYRAGHSWLETSDSLRRHLYKWLQGEDIDQESGVFHLQLVLTNAAMLEYNRVHHPDLDDRYLKGKYNEIQKTKRKRNNSSKKQALGRRV